MTAGKENNDKRMGVMWLIINASVYQQDICTKDAEDFPYKI